VIHWHAAAHALRQPGRQLRVDGMSANPALTNPTVLKFVIQEREAVNHSRFHAQGQRSQRDWLRACGFDGAQFGERKIALRPNPYPGAVRPAAVPGEEGSEHRARMAALRLERADKSQFRFYARREKIFQSHRRLDARQPRGAALLDGRDGDLLPFLALGLGVVGVEVRDDTLVSSGTMRRAPSSTAFSMTSSMIFPLGTATNKLTGQGGAGV